MRANFERVPRFVQKALGRAGKFVGLYPKSWFASFLLLSLVFATGLQNLTFETSNEVLFVPHGSKGLEERRIVEQNFKLDYSNFVRGHETRYGAQVSVIVQAKNVAKHGLLTSGELLKVARDIDGNLTELIAIMKAENTNDKRVAFVDVCAHTRYNTS